MWYALINFLENDEWNDLYALVVFYESIEFITHSECGKVEIEEIYVSTKYWENPRFAPIRLLLSI